MSPRPRVTISLRVNARMRFLIDRAAEVTGKSRSQFILDAACSEASSLLLRPQFFLLDTNRINRFTEALDQAPLKNQRLRALLSVTPPWEQ